jgi:hypothetical protein
MCVDIAVLGYLDPNTSQHIFSMFGPILACLAALGGLAIASAAFIRHWIVSSFQKASRPKRVAIVAIVIGSLAIASLAIYATLR